MRNFNKVLWGIVFITIGIIIGLNALEITNINLLFRGWWTLLIIIPCVIGLFDTKDDGKVRKFSWNSNRCIIVAFCKRNNRF